MASLTPHSPAGASLSPLGEQALSPALAAAQFETNPSAHFSVLDILSRLVEERTGQTRRLWIPSEDEIGLIQIYSQGESLLGVRIAPELRGKGLLQPLLRRFFETFPEVTNVHPDITNPLVLNALMTHFGFKPKSEVTPNAYFGESTADGKIPVYFETPEAMPFYFEHGYIETSEQTLPVGKKVLLHNPRPLFIGVSLQRIIHSIESLELTQLDASDMQRMRTLANAIHISVPISDQSFNRRFLTWQRSPMFHRVWVVRDAQGHIQAYAYAEISPDQTNVHFRELSVSALYRKQGAGTQLAETLMREMTALPTVERVFVHDTNEKSITGKIVAKNLPVEFRFEKIAYSYHQYEWRKSDPRDGNKEKRSDRVKKSRPFQKMRPLLEAA